LELFDGHSSRSFLQPMPSDSNSGGAEETIERESSTTPGQSNTQAEQAQENLRQSRELAENTHQAAFLSEAAFDLGFGIVEIFLALTAVIMMSISLTTSLSLLPTAGALMTIAGIFEILRKFIKRLDRWKR